MVINAILVFDILVVSEVSLSLCLCLLILSFQHSTYHQHHQHCHLIVPDNLSSQSCHRNLAYATDCLAELHQ